MPEIKWIKVTTDIFDDEKIKLIDSLPDRDSIFVIWIKVLTLAGKTNKEGSLFLKDEVPYTIEMLSTIFNRSIKSINKAIDVFVKFGLVDNYDGLISVMNWEKHQNVEKMLQIRYATKERVAKHRRLKRLNTNDVTVTSCNATEQQQKRLDKIKGTDALLRSNTTIKTELAKRLGHGVDSEANKIAVDELIKKVLKKKGVKDYTALAVHMARNE